MSGPSVVKASRYPVASSERPEWTTAYLTPREQVRARPALQWLKLIDQAWMPTTAYAMAVRAQVSADGSESVEVWASLTRWAARLKSSRSTARHALDVLVSLGWFADTGQRRGLGGTKVYALAWPSTAEVMDKEFVASVVAPLREVRRHGVDGEFHGTRTGPTVGLVPDSEVVPPATGSSPTVDTKQYHGGTGVVNGGVLERGGQPSIIGVAQRLLTSESLRDEMGDKVLSLADTRGVTAVADALAVLERKGVRRPFPNDIIRLVEEQISSAVAERRQRIRDCGVCGGQGMRDNGAGEYVDCECKAAS